MRIVCRVVVVLMLVCYGRLAFAQDATLIGSLSKKNDSVTKAMKSVGCNGDWLSKIIADTKLDPAKLRRLPIGQKLYLQGGSCKDNPPPQVANMSRLVLRLDSNSGQAEKLQAEITSLRDSAAATAQQLKSLTEENSQWKTQVAALRVDLVNAKGAAPKVEKGFSFLELILGGWLVLLLAALLGVGSMATTVAEAKIAENTQFPPQVEVEHWGQVHVVPLVKKPDTQQIGYGCTICHKLVFYPEHVKGHYRHVHPKEGQCRWTSAA